MGKVPETQPVPRRKSSLVLRRFEKREQQEDGPVSRYGKSVAYRAWQGPAQGTTDFPKRSFVPLEEPAGAEQGFFPVRHGGRRKRLYTPSNLVACKVEYIPDGRDNKASVAGTKGRPKMRGTDRKEITNVHVSGKIVREPIYPFGPGAAHLLADGTCVVGAKIFQKIGDGTSERRLRSSLEWRREKPGHSVVPGRNRKSKGKGVVSRAFHIRCGRQGSFVKGKDPKKHRTG